MPVKSQAQRAYLNSRFGHRWVKEHHFDQRGPLPDHVGKGKTVKRPKRKLKPKVGPKAAIAYGTGSRKPSLSKQGRGTGARKPPLGRQGEAAKVTKSKLKNRKAPNSGKALRGVKKPRGVGSY